ncbi:MAG: hypothetical protein ACOCXA_01070 [Planctomycetota bacterium]
MTGPGRPDAGPADPPLHAREVSVRDCWDRILGQALNEGLHALAAALVAAEILLCDERRLRLAVPHEHREQLRDGSPGREAFERLLRQNLGWLPAIACQILDRPGSGSDTSDVRNQRYRSAQDHALVQDILRRFNADIIAREPCARDAILPQEQASDGTNEQADS